MSVHVDQRAPGLAARAIVICFLAIGFWYTLWNPLGEGVDETAHFQYIHYIKQHRTLPIQLWKDTGRPPLVSMEHHPPLYYTLGALAISWIETKDASEILIPNPHFVWGVDHPRNGWNVYIHTLAEDWPWRGTVLAMHIVRWLTLLMGAAALWAVYRTGCLMFPNMPWIAVTGMAWLAFNPSFIYMSSNIHHDALMAALYASGLWWLIRLFKHPLSIRESVVGGLLLGAAMLTKLSGLSLAVSFGLGFLLLKLRQKSWRVLLSGVALTYGIALVVSGWWYVCNLLFYGDPLRWALYKSVFWFNIRTGPFTWHTFTHELLYQTAQTFWGAFGFMHITLPPAIWWSLWKIAAVLVNVAVVAMAFLPRRFFSEGRWGMWLVAAGGLVVLFASLVRHAVETGGSGHARYLFPAATALVMALAVGSHALTAFRVQPLVTGLVSLGLGIYAILIPKHFVVHLYPRPETATRAEMASAQAINVCFADAVCVRAGALTPTTETGAYQLTLYWQALPGNRPDLYAFLRLCEQDGTTLLQNEFWPIPSFSTIAWDPEEIYLTRHPILSPPGTPAGTFSLQLAMSANPGRAYLPAYGPSGERWEDFAPLLNLTLEQPVPFSISVDIPRSDELEHRIRLLGYSIQSTSYRPGEVVPITLFWQPMQTIYPNLVVFVHILDAQGNLVAQHDGVPDQGRRPTPFWRPGEVVADLHTIPLPPDLPPGSYTLSVGMYDWPGLQRLRVVAGPKAGQDHIVLQTIQVKR